MELRNKKKIKERDPQEEEQIKKAKQARKKQRQIQIAEDIVAYQASEETFSNEVKALLKEGLKDIIKEMFKDLYENGEPIYVKAYKRDEILYWNESCTMKIQTNGSCVNLKI